MATEKGYTGTRSLDVRNVEESPVQDPSLWVELEIERTGDDDCPIAGQSNTRARGRVQLTGSRCHATLSFENDADDQVSLRTGIVDDGCACATVCGPGMSPVTLDVEDGSLVVRAYVETREHLSNVLELLEESGDQWRLRRLTTPDRNQAVDSGVTHQLFEDVTVTEKQREAVRAAVEMGYYAEPREATLSDLTARLGVSRSAVSQRLTAVESKLIESLSTKL